MVRFEIIQDTDVPDLETEQIENEGNPKTNQGNNDLQNQNGVQEEVIVDDNGKDNFRIFKN